jgi:hypothetical protein
MQIFLKSGRTSGYEVGSQETKGEHHDRTDV